MLKLASTRTMLIIASGLLVISSVVLGILAFKNSTSVQRVSGQQVGGPIELASTQGNFSLTQLDEQQIAVVTFGYTYCPDVCPMNQAVKKQTLSEIKEEERERIVPLMISVDPERDSLERLKEYTNFFGEQFIGATGTQKELEDLAGRYGVFWRKVEADNSEMGYTIDHSASIYLVNREGDILQQVPYSSSSEGLVTALNHFLIN